MTKSTFRVALFAALILVTQAAPGSLPRVEVPTRVEVPSRGGGCGGGAAPVPMPAPRVTPPEIMPPRFTPPVGPVIRPPVEPPVTIPPGIEPRPPLPGDAPLPGPVAGASRPDVARVSMELLKVQELGERGEWVALGRQIDGIDLAGASPPLRSSLGQLRAQAKELHALEVLQAGLAESGTKDFNGAVIKASLALLQETSKDSPLVERVCRALIAKAEATGRPEVARELRDLKLGGSGPGETGPGQPPGGPPPLPTPGSGSEGVRPQLKERPGEVLPPLAEKTSSSTASPKATVGEELSRYASRRREEVAPHLPHPGELTSGHKDHDSDEGTYEAEVRSALGRELTASERVLVRMMRKQGKKPAEVANLLKGL
jgi:hypothetical protein